MSVRFFAFVLAFALGSCDQADPEATTPKSETSANPGKPTNPETTTPNKETPANPEKPANPEVVLETSSGTIVLELDPENAPLTTENFLTYVNDGFYDGTIFHRVIDDFMIQGGGFELIDGSGTQKETRDPVKNEAKNGLKNTRGTISMARTNNPDSATSQFFINLVDNPGLDPKTPENPRAFSPDGYTVFGKVTKGMDVVDKIRGVDTGVKRLKARGPGGDLREAPMQDVPLQNVIIEKATASQSR